MKIGIIGAVAGLCNGLFGSGRDNSSTSMIYLLKVEEHDAHATAIAVILPLSLASIIYFRTTISIGILYGKYVQKRVEPV